MVRLRISEIQPLHVRHEIPPGDVVSDPPPKVAQVTTADESGKTTFKFVVDGLDVEATLQHSPLGLDIAVGGQVVQRPGGTSCVSDDLLGSIGSTPGTC